MVRILIVNYKFTSLKGGEHRIQNLAKGLTSIGLKGVFVSAYGISNTLENMRYENKNILIRKYFNITSKCKVLGVLCDILLNVIMLLKYTIKCYLRERNLEIIIVSVPVLFKLIPFLLLKKSRIVIVDFGDMWSKYTYVFHKLVGKGYLGIADILANIFIRIEEVINLRILAKLYKVYDAVIITVPTRSMELFLKNLGFTNTFLLYHPVDIPLGFNKNEPMILKRTKYIHLIVFSSSDFNSTEELDTIVEIAERVRKEGLVAKFIVITSHPKIMRDRLSRYLDSNYLVVLPALKREDYLKIMKHVHLAIILEPRNVSKVSLIPRHISKVAEFMCLGIPVVTNSLALRDYVINGYNGYIVPLDRIPIVIQRLVKEWRILQELRANAIRFCESKLSSNRAALKLLKMILQVVKDHYPFMKKKIKNR